MGVVYVELNRLHFVDEPKQHDPSIRLPSKDHCFAHEDGGAPAVEVQKEDANLSIDNMDEVLVEDCEDDLEMVADTGDAATARGGDARERQHTGGTTITPFTDGSVAAADLAADLVAAAILAARRRFRRRWLEQSELMTAKVVRGCGLVAMRATRRWVVMAVRTAHNGGVAQRWAAVNLQVVVGSMVRWR
ncbi:hypothetical protein SESBI_15148 [Sesbania bispinosa]|nr:hypothetical protein SESBI_15148 [Sesbania bispinosa]